MESVDTTPRVIDVPRAVELDVFACTSQPTGCRALAELVGLTDSHPPNVQEEILRALARGRLVYETWSGFHSRVGDSADPVDLSELSAEESEIVAMHSVVIELVGEDDEPIPHVAYQLLDPDGRTRRGRLDGDGRAEVHDISKAGTCKVCFPDFDEEAWEYISAVPL